MEWQEIKEGFWMATVEEDVPVGEAMCEFCDQILDNVLAENDGVDWNYIRVEFWSDSGRMIAFPANTSKKARIEKAACQVVFDALLSEYEQLADSDLEDDAFTNALVACERKWMDRFISAARSRGLRGNQVQFWDGHGDAAMHTEQI